jgi:DNA polymerase-3 subunit delta'
MARILNHLAGHAEIVERLLSAAERGQLPSTFLFVGPPGVGRKKTALGLAQALVCEKNRRGCGECGPCLRVEKGQSEAVRLIEPEKTQIKIEQSREIIEFLSLRSISRARIVIIDQAETLNPHAANTLLKILEEPPENSYFFMIAPSARHVLSTLRSRSQVVRFGSLTEEDLRRNVPAPPWALRSAMGSFERLQSLIGRDEIKLRAQAWQLLSDWFNGQAVYLEEESREWRRDRSVLLGLVRYWILALRDAMVFRAGERERLLNADQQQGIEKLSSLGPELLGEVMRLALELESGLLAQRDPQLGAEEFWIRSRRLVEAARANSL